MKKFLTFMIVLIVCFTFGLVIFRLLRNEEVVSISATNAYYNVDEKISFNYKVDNKNKSSKITVESSNEAVVRKLDNGDFVAVGGGNCQIVLTHTNPKGNVTTLAKDVVVGDGTESNPFFVRTEQEFLNIGIAESSAELATKLSYHYVQTSNITLSSAFSPIDGTLTGSYRGMLIDDNSSITKKSYTKIINYTVKSENDLTGEFTSLFRNIGPTGKFGYITFENVDIEGSFDNASVVCVKNEGIIDFVTISGKITTTSSKPETKIASIAIESSYNKGNTVAQISRCKNTAELTTAGNKIAGIVYKNSGKVLFSINGNEVANSGKLTANGTDLIAGGIVGENYYGFGNELRDAITSGDNDKANDALNYRPQVKDCYTTNNISATLSGNYSVGGIIGKEIFGYDKVSENEYNQVYDNLTMGNYYLIVDDAIYTRGVGNLSYTDQSVTDIYRPQTRFVAIGVDVEQLTRGIDTTTPDGQPAKASLTSYVQSGSAVTWKDENIYSFYVVNGIHQLPFIRQTENYFGTISYRVPSTSINFENIPDLDTFLRTNFTTTTPSGAPKEYKITGYIDFNDSVNASDFNTYFNNTGTEQNPAQFIIRAEQVTDQSGTPLTDENGNPIYYGFKNFSPTFANNAKYVGIFGYIKNSTIENVSFIDCFASAIDQSETSTATYSIGVVAGHAENSTLSNLTFLRGGESGGNGVEMAIATGLAGGIVGNFVDSSLSNVSGLLGVSATNNENNSSIIGGIVGRSVNSNYNNIDCEIDVSGGQRNAGGFAGRLERGEANNIKLNVNITGDVVGGFAYIINGASVSTVKLSSTLAGATTSAGVAITAEEGASFVNASVNSLFKAGRTAQVGLFATLRNTASAERVVFTNNFDNSLGKFYSKTINVAAQIFTGDRTIDAQRNVASGAGTLTNCFVYNQINGSTNYNESRTVFYPEQLGAINISAISIQNDSFDPTSKTVVSKFQVITIFGKYGAGILNSTGRLYTESTNASNFKNNREVGIKLSEGGFGFTSEWNFDGFPTINF